MLQRWAHAYRDSVYHAAVNTNNGIEAQNKLFKYNFLPRNKQRATVSAITTLLVEDYLPTAYQKYLLQNYKQTSMYRTYNDFVPDYLRDRPRNIILHCLDRMARSHKLTASNIIDNDQEKGIFEIMKSSGAKYRVSFGNDNPDSMPSCTCQDWTNWHIPCKHFFAIFKHRSAWQWSNLPPSYLHSPYLSTDVEALKKHFDGSPVLNLNDDNDVHNAELIQQSTQNLQVKVCVIMYMYIIMILCMLKLGWLEVVICVGKQYKHLIVGIAGHVQVCPFTCLIENAIFMIV